jgi:hypothetical protein
MMRIWPTVVRAIGGVYDVGPLMICLHDDGVCVAWRQVEIWSVTA